MSASRPALRTLLTSLWGCSPCKIVSVLLVLLPLLPGTPSHLPKDIDLRPSVCRNPITPTVTSEGTGIVAPKPFGLGHQVVLLGAGRGSPQPVSSVLALLLYPCGGQKWGQGSSTVGEQGVQGGLAQPHSRSPLCAPCLHTQAKEKFLENYNFVS